MINPSEIEAAAFTRVSKTTDGLVVIAFIEEMLLRQDKENRTTEHSRVQLGQGKSQALDKIITFFGN